MADRDRSPQDDADVIRERCWTCGRQRPTESEWAQVLAQTNKQKNLPMSARVALNPSLCWTGELQGDPACVPGAVEVLLNEQAALLAEKDAEIEAMNKAFDIIANAKQPPDGVFRFFQRLHGLPEVGGPPNVEDLIAERDEARAALERTNVSLVAAEREIERLRGLNGVLTDDYNELLVTYSREKDRADALAAQVRTLTEALDWLRFSLGSWAVYRERQPCAVFDSNEHRDVLDRIQSALASVQQPPDWSKCNCGAGPSGIHATWCSLAAVQQPPAEEQT